MKLTRVLLRKILADPHKHEWSLQGLGMLRLYLGGNWRLHIWDRRFAFPGASPIHDHLQWGLESTIVSGKLVNVRYSIEEGEATHLYTTLKAGYGCFFRYDPLPVCLSVDSRETYYPGDSYTQFAEEIHESIPADGTITMMCKFPTADAESARVFWPINDQWGSAEPRPATAVEVDAITSNALALLKA